MNEGWKKVFDHMDGIDGKDQFAEFMRLLDHLLDGKITDLDPEDVLNRMLEYDYLRKRYENTPPEYILGEAVFMGRRYIVNNHTLIPTPETFLLVDLARDHIASIALKNYRPIIVDVGTGCGNIAISIALENPDAEVYAIDISPDALEVAKLNVQRYGLDDRVHIIEGDLLSPIREMGLSSKIDMIVCNPPYIPRSSIERMDPQIKDHEPHIALDGGPFGIDILNRLINESSSILKEGGSLAFEFGEGQENLVGRLFKRSDIFSHVEFLSYNGSMRFIKACRDQ
ncbi:MAG: peptide chain release factor N(5)-glutamine methyltransferase [Candidatus Thermoplasmatota archaeon]|nr:peptide chain release factor N(5)-glutamine methyltransferase [Candidatus Thermoplasmatota archaeon]